MKKKYVVPESRLYSINLNESIAVSGGTSEIAGSAVISFTSELDGCRTYYSGVRSAKVETTGTAFIDYYNELVGYGSEAYFSCFRYKFG